MSKSKDKKNKKEKSLKTEKKVEDSNIDIKNENDDMNIDLLFGDKQKNEEKAKSDKVGGKNKYSNLGNANSSAQIDSQIKRGRPQHRYPEEDLLNEAQRLRDSIFSKSKVDMDYETFINRTEFRKILKRSKNEEVFLAMVQENIFPDCQDEFQLNESNTSNTTSRQSTNKKVLAKRKRKGASAGIFAPVSGDGKLKFPQVISNLLHPDVPVDLRRELQYKISEWLEKDEQLAEKVLTYSYKALLDDIVPINDYFQLLNHLISKEDFRVDEIMEALLQKIDLFSDLSEGDKKQFSLKYIQDVYEKKFIFKKQAAEWKQLTDLQQTMVLSILSYAVEFTMNDDQAAVISQYISCQTEQQAREDFFWKLFLKQRTDIRIIGLRHAFNLTGKKAELVSDKFTELFSYEIVDSIQKFTLDQSKLEIIGSFENILRQYQRFQTILRWLGDKTVLQVLKKFIVEEPTLNFDTIQDCIQRLFDKISDLQFEKHLKANLQAVTCPSELNTLITNYFDSGIALRNVNAGKKINSDLCKHLKIIEKAENISIDQKDVFDDYYTTKCIDDYTLQTGITLYQWQRQIVQHAFYVSKIVQKNIVIQVPTGHGKTIIIAALAKALCEKDKGKVVVVTMNNYLNHHALNKYGISNICQKFPKLPAPGQILYLSNAELMTYNEEKLKDAIIIYDEIDRCFQDQICNIQQDLVSKQMVMKYPPMIISKCKSIIGFSGTLSESTLKQTALCQVTTFYKLKLKPVVDLESNKIVAKKLYKNMGEREAAILETVKYHLRENSSVIVIDEFLKPDKSFLKDKLTNQSVLLFDQWGNGQFATIDDKLKKLQKAVDPTVVHTNLMGVRGVDFKMDMQTHVVLAFSPKNYYDIVQALGRGARFMFQRCDGTIIMDARDDKNNIDVGEIKDYYEKQESEEDTIEELRMNLLKIGHGKVMKCTTEQAEKVQKIFRERLSIYYLTEQEDAQAVANWKLIKEVYPEGELTHTPVDFLQNLNDFITQELEEKTVIK